MSRVKQVASVDQRIQMFVKADVQVTAADFVVLKSLNRQHGTFGGR